MTLCCKDEPEIYDGRYKGKSRDSGKAFVDPALTTDIIVGFPGETEEEFEATRRFLEEIGLYEMHVFKYSKEQAPRRPLWKIRLMIRKKAEGAKF